MEENSTATDSETRWFGRGGRVYIKVQGCFAHADGHGYRGEQVTTVQYSSRIRLYENWTEKGVAR